MAATGRTKRRANPAAALKSRTVTMSAFRANPQKVLRSLYRDAVILTLHGEPVAVLRRWETRGTGRRLANERRRS